MTNTGQQQSVHKRHVFYVPGYDPILPRRYRELYRSEGGDQAQISGYDLNLRAAQKAANYGWHVSSTIDAQSTETQFEILLWSDIVQASMRPSILNTYFLLCKTAWVYITTGALRNLMKLRTGPIIAALYPVVFLLSQLLLGLLAGWVGYRLGALAHSLVGAIAFIALLIGVLKWFKSKDNKFYAYYLMHDYSFSARSLGANPPELEARMVEFVTRIHEVWDSDIDEILVVGHSSGAHLAISILADLLRETDKPPRAALSFLSLGQVVPMVSFLPRADRLRQDLYDLCQDPRLTWVDVTAPADGCTFALCDPVAVSGVAPETGKRGPLIVSAAFSKTLSEAKYNSIKRRFFRLHFQYLCAFDRPGDYDYFQISAGPMTLGERYADRQPSPSKLEMPVNRFTSRDV
jgi:hypothetical protein